MKFVDLLENENTHVLHVALKKHLKTDVVKYIFLIQNSINFRFELLLIKEKMIELHIDLLQNLQQAIFVFNIPSAV
jgi:hypothetical protein